MDTRQVTQEVRMAKWAEIIRAQKSSGQTIKAWCEANGVSRQRYFYWQRQFRESICENLSLQQGTEIVAPVSFAEVGVPVETNPTGLITIRVDGAVVEIAGEASPGAIEAVLRALGQR